MTAIPKKCCSLSGGAGREISCSRHHSNIELAVVSAKESPKHTRAVNLILATRRRAGTTMPDLKNRGRREDGMGQRVCAVAGRRLLWSLLILVCLLCLQHSSAAAQVREQISSGWQKEPFDKPVMSEVVFGKNSEYLAVLFCCWNIRVYEKQGNMLKMIWDWQKFSGADGFKEDFLVRDVDADGKEEVAFRTSKASFCRVESSAVLYFPGKRTVCLLQHDGELGLYLSPNLKDDMKSREWLVKYWQDWYRGDITKLTVTYDAQP